MIRFKRSILILVLLVIIITVGIFVAKNTPKTSSIEDSVVLNNYGHFVNPRIQGKITETTDTYTNPDFGFSFTYPHGLVTDKSQEIDCITYNPKTDSQGGIHTHIKSGTLMPVTFEQQFLFDWYGKPEEAPVFLGVVRYVDPAPCIGPHNLIEFNINTKNKHPDLSSYVNTVVATMKKEQSENSIQKTSVEVNGKEVPMIRTISRDPRGNTIDDYFFEKGNHIYTLKVTYPHELIPETQVSHDWSEPMWRDYQLSQEIIKNFKLD